MYQRTGGDTVTRQHNTHHECCCFIVLKDAFTRRSGARYELTPAWQREIPEKD